jgi:hypothetical protein
MKNQLTLETRSEEIGSNQRSMQSSSARYGAHVVRATPPYHSPFKIIIVIALAAFMIPMIITLCKQTPEDRQAWANAHPLYDDHTAANIAQIFQSLRQLLAG